MRLDILSVTECVRDDLCVPGIDDERTSFKANRQLSVDFSFIILFLIIFGISTFVRAIDLFELTLQNLAQRMECRQMYGDVILRQKGHQMRTR